LTSWVEAEVQASRVEVVEVPELAVLDEVTQAPHRGVVLERVADHQGHAGGAGGVHHRPSLDGGDRERLLHHHVLAVRDGLEGQGRVRARRGRDHDRVDVGEGRVEARVALDPREGPGDGVAPVGVGLDDRDLGHGLEGQQGTDVLGPPVTTPDDSHAEPVL